MKRSGGDEKDEKFLLFLSFISVLFFPSYIFAQNPSIEWNFLDVRQSRKQNGWSSQWANSACKPSVSTFYLRSAHEKKEENWIFKEYNNGNAEFMILLTFRTFLFVLRQILKHTNYNEIVCVLFIYTSLLHSTHFFICVCVFSDCLINGIILKIWFFNWTSSSGRVINYENCKKYIEYTLKIPKYLNRGIESLYLFQWMGALFLLLLQAKLKSIR